MAASCTALFRLTVPCAMVIYRRIRTGFILLLLRLLSQSELDRFLGHPPPSQAQVSSMPFSSSSSSSFSSSVPAASDSDPKTWLLVPSQIGDRLSVSVFRVDFSLNRRSNRRTARIGSKLRAMQNKSPWKLSNDSMRLTHRLTPSPKQCRAFKQPGEWTSLCIVQDLMYLIKADWTQHAPESGSAGRKRKKQREPEIEFLYSQILKYQLMVPGNDSSSQSQSQASPTESSSSAASSSCRCTSSPQAAANCTLFKYIKNYHEPPAREYPNILRPWREMLLVTLRNWYWTHEQKLRDKYGDAASNDDDEYQSDDEPIDEALGPIALFDPVSGKLTPLRVHIPPDMPTSLPAGKSRRTRFGLDEIDAPESFVIGTAAQKDMLFLSTPDLILKCTAMLCVVEH